MNTGSTINIADLQLRLAADDQSAFRELYDYFSPRLLQFAFAIIHSRETAEEIVEDAFVQIWKNRLRVSRLENLNWYLYITTRNISYSYHRKQKRHKHYELDDIVLPYYQVDATPEDILISRELLQLINRAINNLPPKCRLIFKLVKEDKLKYCEVAELLQLSDKTVENQIGIALKKIHSAIRKHLPQSFGFFR
jgi:RNA polymerase sigma-70 factor (family 1)